MTVTTGAAANRQRFTEAFARFAAGDVDVLHSVLRDDFVEHSPGNPSGREAFVEYIRTAPVTGSRLHLKRVIADDEYVVAHYHMVEPGGGAGTAVVDIWRFEGDLIAEHWDVVQPVPEASSIPNGMF